MADYQDILNNVNQEYLLWGSGGGDALAMKIADYLVQKFKGSRATSFDSERVASALSLAASGIGLQTGGFEMAAQLQANMSRSGVLVSTPGTAYAGMLSGMSPAMNQAAKMVQERLVANFMNPATGTPGVRAHGLTQGQLGMVAGQMFNSGIQHGIGPVFNASSGTLSFNDANMKQLEKQMENMASAVSSLNRIFNGQAFKDLGGAIRELTGGANLAEFGARAASLRAAEILTQSNAYFGGNHMQALAAYSAAGKQSAASLAAGLGMDPVLGSAMFGSVGARVSASVVRAGLAASGSGASGYFAQRGMNLNAPSPEQVMQQTAYDTGQIMSQEKEAAALASLLGTPGLEGQEKAAIRAAIDEIANAGTSEAVTRARAKAEGLHRRITGGQSTAAAIGGRTPEERSRRLGSMIAGLSAEGSAAFGVLDQAANNRMGRSLRAAYGSDQMLLGRFGLSSGEAAAAGFATANMTVEMLQGFRDALGNPDKLDAMLNDPAYRQVAATIGAEDAASFEKLVRSGRLNKDAMDAMFNRRNAYEGVDNWVGAGDRAKSTRRQLQAAITASKTGRYGQDNWAMEFIRGLAGEEVSDFALIKAEAESSSSRLTRLVTDEKGLIKATDDNSRDLLRVLDADTRRSLGVSSVADMKKLLGSEEGQLRIRNAIASAGMGYAEVGGKIAVASTGELAALRNAAKGRGVNETLKQLGLGSVGEGLLVKGKGETDSEYNERLKSLLQGQVAKSVIEGNGIETLLRAVSEGGAGHIRAMSALDTLKDTGALPEEARKKMLGQVEESLAKEKQTIESWEGKNKTPEEWAAATSRIARLDDLRKSLATGGDNSMIQVASAVIQIIGEATGLIPKEGSGG